MRLATYRTDPGGPAKVGAQVETAGSAVHVADLQATLAVLWNDEAGALAARERAAARVPAGIRQLLALGDEGLADCRLAINHVETLAAGEGGVEALLAAGILHAEDAIEFLPVVDRPGKMICAGLNYGDHVAESADAGIERGADSRAFAKFPSSLIGHGAEIHYPRETSQLDYEGELAIVIGKAVSNVERVDAWDAIVGYTVFNDVSSRDVQFEEMRAGMLLLGKNPNHGSPIGPYLVTADEIADPHALSLELKVNGEVRQSGSTDELILGCDELVSYWSAIGLEPGDVIATGTPAGVGIFMDPPERYLLKPGDRIEVRIEGLGTLRNEVVETPKPS